MSSAVEEEVSTLPAIRKQRSIHDALPRGPAALRGNKDLNPPRWTNSPGAKRELGAGWYFEKSPKIPQRRQSDDTEKSSSKIWEKLWDPKQFTGCHKHRFDLTTGKGKGKAGRIGGHLPKRNSPSPVPRMLVCHICGTMHGAWSLVHHLGPCAARRARSNMPPASNPPGVPIPAEDCTLAECEVYNEAALAAYESALPFCRVCTRTFSTVEKLRKHEMCCVQILDKTFYKPRGMTGRASPENASVRPASPQRGRGYGPGYQRQGKEFVNGISL